jgi:cytochrome P450
VAEQTRWHDRRVGGQPSPRPEAFDAFSRETIENPYPFYRAMREHAPVFRPRGADWWYVSRFDDIKGVARDTETYSSKIVAVLLSGGEGRLLQLPALPFFPVDVLAIADPPVHGVHRKLSTAALGRSFPKDLEAWMREKVDGLLDACLTGGRLDWMQGVAFELPMQVALRLLSLDIGEHERVKALSDDAIDLLAGTTSRLRMARDMVGAFRLYRWCVRAFESAQRERPSGLMGGLVQGVQSGTITKKEASSMVLQILIAGSDSSASLMGSAVAMLAQRPELQDELRANPDRIAAFIEEAIRLESPFQGHFRQTTRPCELAGTSLPAGARLFLAWGSGNRDEQHYADAEVIDLQREKPRAHLSFGHGIHLCIGAALGRLEARLAVSALLERTRSIRLAGVPLRHRASVFVRTLEALELEVELA